MTNKATDLLGNEIFVGDKVLFMQIKYRNFMEGFIKTMAKTSALISHERTNTCQTESRQTYGQMISLSALERITSTLQSENTRLKAERDKAVEDIKIISQDGLCCICKFIGQCTDSDDCCFIWRGLEETK